MSPSHASSSRLVLLIFGAVAPDVRAGKRPKLPPNYVAVVDASLVSNYGTANPLVVLTTLAPLIAELNEHQLVALDEVLSARNLPHEAQLLADARGGLVRKGLGSRLPAARGLEVFLIVPPLREKVLATPTDPAPSL